MRLRKLSVSVTAFAVAMIVGATLSLSAMAASDPTGVWQSPTYVTTNVAPTNGDVSKIRVISCASAGNCSAIGRYSGTLTVGGNHTDSDFTVDETNGKWGSARILDPTDNSETYQFTDISCASAGNCTAVGWHAGTGTSGFVMDEAGGAWGSPQLVVPALNSVSCSAAGECAAVGVESNKAAAISETSGTWGAAVVLSGSYNTAASFTSVSCASGGNCAAGGFYDSVSGVSGYVLLANEASGTWGSVQPVTGSFAGNGSDNGDTISSVSCSSAGNCGAAGYYGPSTGASPSHAFVVSEVNGAWQPTVDVGDSLGVSGARLNSISCPTDGSCTAVGYYIDANAYPQALVVDQSAGSWHAGQEVAASLNVGGWANLTSVSCTSAGNCGAGGWYTNSSGGFVGLGVDEVNGTWSAGDAVATSSIADGLAKVKSISCPAVGSCAAAGDIDNASAYQVAFVVDEKPGAPTSTTTTSTGSTSTSTTSTSTTSTSTSTPTTSSTPLGVHIPSRHAVVSHGKAQVKLKCTGAANSFCHGTLTLTARERIIRHVHHRRVVKHRTVVLGKHSYRLAAGHAKVFSVHLTRTARRLLKRAKHHRLHAIAHATLTGGTAASRKIVL